MRTFLIRTVVAAGVANLTLLGLSGTMMAAHAQGPEGCIAASQGTGGPTTGGFAAIGAVNGSNTPSSAPSLGADCAYNATTAAVGYAAAGTYTIEYGAGQANSAGTSCTWAIVNNVQITPTVVSSGSAAAPTASPTSIPVAGDCVQVATG
jgi:hypothetical protein